MLFRSYETWHTLSLSRLAADREIEVGAKNGNTAIFSAKDGFFLQLAKLSHLTDEFARRPNARIRIDLSLGREVPVMIQPLERERPAPPGAKPGANSFLSNFSVSQLKIKREL